MSSWHLRDFAPEDLENAVRLDERRPGRRPVGGMPSSTTDEPPIFALAEVVKALADRQPAVVAITDGHMVGSAVGRIDGDTAWVLRLALDPRWRGKGLGSELISALEHRLLAAGVRRIRAVLPDDETGNSAFLNSGFALRRGVSFYEKAEQVTHAPLRC